MGRNFWQIYQSLVEPISENLSIQRVCQNQKWSAIESECGSGVALSFASLDSKELKKICGRPLKEIASWIFSWDFAKASIGAAAVNAYWNQRETIEKIFDSKLENFIAKVSIEDFIRKNFHGQKILFVGYFPFADALKNDCQVSILERRDLPGTFPDSACEALIPEQHLIIMSASTLINKTYVRLAELSQGIASFLVGPSTPLNLSPAKDGFNQSSGLVIRDSNLLFNALERGASREILGSQISWKVDLLFEKTSPKSSF